MHFGIKFLLNMFILLPVRKMNGKNCGSSSEGYIDIFNLTSNAVKEHFTDYKKCFIDPNNGF